MGLPVSHKVRKGGGGGGGRERSKTIKNEVAQSDLPRFHLKQGDCATIAAPDPDLEIRVGVGGEGGLPKTFFRP